MKKSDILKLPLEKTSLKKITNYLNNHSDLDVFLKKVEVIIALNKYNEALKELYELVNHFNSMEDNEVVKVTNLLMELLLKCKRPDEYLRFLNIKKERIKPSSSYETLKDEFNYLVFIKNYNEALKIANEYLNFEIDVESKETIYLEILKIANSLNNTNLYLDTITKLINLYQNSFNFSKINYFNILKFRYLNKINDPNLEEEILTYLKTPDLTTDFKLEAAAYLIKIRVNNKEYNKASLIESDYNEYLKDNYSLAAKLYANEALNLFKELKHKISIAFYEEYLKNFKETEEPKTKKEDIIVIPEINKTLEIKKENKTPKVVVKEVVVTKDVNVSDDYNIIKEGLTILNNATLKIRESFRQFGIFLNKNYMIESFNILFIKNKEYYLYFYKNERLYERKITTLTTSLETKVFKMAEDSLYYNETNLNNEIDIFYSKEINYKYLLALNIYNNNKDYFGKLFYYSNEDILNNNNYYEELNIYKDVINYLINYDLKLENINDQYQTLEHIKNHSIVGFKTYYKEELTFSNQAKYILNIPYDISYKDYLAHIDNKDVINYQNVLKNVILNKENNKEITYLFSYNNLKVNVKEIIYYLPTEDDFKLVSLIINNDDNINKVLEYKDKAYYSVYSNMYNMALLKEKIDKGINNYHHLVYFTFPNLKLLTELYGQSFYDEVVTILNKALNSFFKASNKILYFQIDKEIFSILYNYKLDKRSLKANLKALYEYLKTSFYELSSNVELDYRFIFINGYNKNFDTLNKYLLDGLKYLEMTNNNDVINEFDFDMHKTILSDRLNIEELNMAIDNNYLEIKFRPIVDLKNEVIYAYYVDFNQINKDNYLLVKDLILKKNLTNKFEHALIYNVGQALNKVYQALEGYVEVVVNLSSETIDDKLAYFIYEQFSYFKVPYNILNIIVPKYNECLDKLKKLEINIITRDIYDIFNGNSKVLLINKNDLNNEKIKEVVSILNNYEAKLMIEDVDNNYLNKIESDEEILVSGKCFEETYNLNNLIKKLKS